MSDIAIIGIHGLENKVEHATLENWWKAAIEEGLARNHGRNDPLPFRMAYWANVRNTDPVAIEEEREPYRLADGSGPFVPYAGSAVDVVRAKVQALLGGRVDRAKDLFSWDGTERLIGIRVADLSAYYQDEAIRRQIRERLVDVLLASADKRILLLAHSMGSIVAYDVLRDLEADASIEVAHLLTLGSPLGLPLVSRHIRGEFHDQRAPANVRAWTNVADPGDKVALDIALADEYEPSATGIRPRDVLIRNGYVSPAGRENRHKSYGYLRAPEVSSIVDAFLSGGSLR
ncbi:MAG: alpha/beta hydrolase [Rhodocyclaceae bacterium]|nr:alpha/beta hydrolase [Rhodocyclaceae bacterium]